MSTDTAPSNIDVSYGISRLLQGSLDLTTGSVGHALQQLLQAARLYMGMEVAFVSEINHGLRIFRYVDQSDNTSLLRVGDSDPVDESYCKHVIDGRLPELIRNAQELDFALNIDATEALGIGAHVSVPIYLSDGSIYGTFCAFTFHADYSLNERDLALMRAFADVTGQLIAVEVQRHREQEEKRQRIQSLIDSRSLAMVWQPITELETGRIVGAESLARFPLGLHDTPDQWFNEATAVGMAAQLEGLAVRQATAILELVPEPVYITCNLSAEAFLDPYIQDMMASLPLHRIVLEITEHDVIEDYDTLSASLEPLRRKGLRIAIDDAGAGYASFRHILSLRPDMIKLDISLTRNIDTDIGRRSLAASLVQFSKEIGCQLIAEGVETRAELDVLTGLGVHKVQGFYLHRPKPKDEFLSLLSSFHGDKERQDANPAQHTQGRHR